MDKRNEVTDALEKMGAISAEEAVDRRIEALRIPYKRHRTLYVQHADHPELTGRYVHEGDVNTAAAMAAEYQRWIDFHAAGSGDYEDFLRKVLPA